MWAASLSVEPSCWVRWMVEGTRLERKGARRRMSALAYLREIRKVARSLGDKKASHVT